MTFFKGALICAPYFLFLFTITFFLPSLHFIGPMLEVLINYPYLFAYTQVTLVIYTNAPSSHSTY
jgi:hypothetical protein